MDWKLGFLLTLIILALIWKSIICAYIICSLLVFLFFEKAYPGRKK